MANKSSRTVLIHEWVTGGGLAGSPLPASWAAEGRAMRQAIAADFARVSVEPMRVIVTSDERLPVAAGPWTTVQITANDNPGRVRDLARAADLTVLIAPETSGVLASLTRDLESAGAQLLGSTAQAVELTADKAALAKRLQALSIETPPTRTIVPGDGLPLDAPYPAVLKPVDGAGSVDTFYLADAQSLPDCARAMPAALLQPFIPGTPMSASFLVGQGGQSRLIGTGIQRMTIREGRFEYHGGTLPVPCGEALPQIQPAIDAISGLRGFVGVDFIWNAEKGRATILEINPRPTTSYVGWSGLLPRGLLACSWLAIRGFANLDARVLEALAKSVNEIRRGVSFTTDGKLSHDEKGVLVS